MAARIDRTATDALEARRWRLANYSRGTALNDVIL